jgi:hypothetical protein
MKVGVESWIAKNFPGRVFQIIPTACRYAVSDKGDVISFFGERPRALKPSVSGFGYKAFKLVDNYGNRKTTYVHTVVAENFLGPRPDNNVIRHLDGDCTNNRIDNLAYGTQKDNEADKSIYGVRKATNAKLTASQVNSIRERHSFGAKQKSLADEFSVSPMCINRIVRGVSWK